jgi:hypothetical protein
MIISNISLSAQGRFSVSAGLGYYELINIGARWNVSELSSLSVFAGTNFWVNDKKLLATGLSYDHTFRNAHIWKLKPGYSIGVYYWTSDDDLYYFSSMAFPAMIMLSLPVSESLSFRVEGGGVLNAVLVSERKQNVEAGYPARGNGNGRVSVIYKFGAK